MKENDFQENDNFSNIVYSQNVIDFVTVANQYCILAENALDYETKDFVNKSLRLLSIIYIKALGLEKPSVMQGVEVEKFVNEMDWAVISNKVAEKLSENDNYVDIIEPMNVGEPLNLSLSECFADVYQDLKDFSTLYKVAGAESINEALWECVDNFEQLWGPRTLAVVKELHNILYGNSNFESSLKKEKNENDLSGDKWVNKLFGD